MMQGYGMTEMTVMTIANPRSCEFPVVRGSIGVVLPNTEAKVDIQFTTCKVMCIVMSG